MDQFVPGHVQQAVRPADGDRDAIGEGEDPLHRAIDQPGDRREPGRRRQLEMRVDDRAEASRHVEAGQQARRDRRGHGEDHAVVGAERDRTVDEVEAGERVALDPEPAHRMVEADGGAAVAEVGQRRVDEGGPQPVGGDQRAAGRAPLGERLPDDGAGQRRRAFRRVGVEGREQERLPQPLVEQAPAGHRLADRRRPAGPHQPRETEVVASARARHAATGGEDPPRQAAGVGPQRPPFAAGQVDEREIGAGRPFHLVLGADRAQERARLVVARQQQVVAVVDGHAERGVVIGATAPARLTRTLVQHDPPRTIAKRNGGGEPGETGADDMDGASRHGRHPTPLCDAADDSAQGDILKQDRARSP